MAMHDLRVFRHLDKWWGAVVLSGGGVSTGGVPAITRERIFFTALYEPKENSKTAAIPAGWLNLLRHDSLTGILGGASDFGQRWEMVGYNQPSSEDYFGYTRYRDPMGLEWVYRETESPTLTVEGSVTSRPAVEFVCLEDSALHKTISLQDSATRVGGLGVLNERLVSELVQAIHNTYRSLAADWDD